MDLDTLYEEMRGIEGSWRRHEWGPGDAWRSRASAHQYRLLFELLHDHVPPGSRVLDWGSGPGRMSYSMLRLGHDVDSYDFVEPPMRHVLEGRGGDRFRFTLASEPESLPYDTATFDVVTSVGVLEHVRDTGGDEAVSLKEIARVLRPGGAFVCVHLPNKWSWIDFVARRRATAHHHVYRYRPDDIRSLLRSSGFELASSVQSYGILPRNSLGRLPDTISETRVFARALDAIDGVGATVLRPLCQNFGFVARTRR